MCARSRSMTAANEPSEQPSKTTTGSNASGNAQYTPQVVCYHRCMVVDGDYESELWHLINQLHARASVGKSGVLATGVMPHAKAWSHVILQSSEVRCVLQSGRLKPCCDAHGPPDAVRKQMAAPRHKITAQ